MLQMKKYWRQGLMSDEWSRSLSSAWGPSYKDAPWGFSSERQGWWSSASVCSGNALLGDLLGLTRSVEREFLSVLSYPAIFLSLFMYCKMSSYTGDILSSYVF